MLGKRKPQRELFDVGNVFPVALEPKSFHGQLAAAAPHLFRDEDFAKAYSSTTGRPSVPPSQLALLTLLQHEAGVSDAEAVARSAFDLRWAAVLGRTAGEPLCAKSTFQLFRAHLILHDLVREVFQRSIQEAKAAGLLKSGPLRVAVDTKPILGRGAVEDTYNLLATGIRQLAKALAKAQRRPVEAWARTQDLRRYFDGSVKGSAEVDWSAAEARHTFLLEIVTDARRLLRLTGVLLPSLPEAARAGVQEAATLLEQLLLQDVEETSGPGGRPQATLREGTAKGRVPSATDPEQRHGRKSKSKRFTGHKATVAVDQESQILVDADVLPGDAADATEVQEQVERAEKNTGQPVVQTVGDCAYGGGETRQEFADAGRVLYAKVPQERTNGEFFPKSMFQINLEAGTVTCPAGKTAAKATLDGKGGRLYSFGTCCVACPLRAQCTTAPGGRQVRVHPQEALLRAARAFQASPEGRRVLRGRVVVEHRLARLGQLGIGQARYGGRKKVRFQVLLAATLANLRRTWNWQAETPPPPAADGPSCPSHREPEPGSRWLHLRWGWENLLHGRCRWEAVRAT